jgi:hypothetical protein
MRSELFPASAKAFWGSITQAGAWHHARNSQRHIRSRVSLSVFPPLKLTQNLHLAPDSRPVYP